MAPRRRASRARRASPRFTSHAPSRAACTSPWRSISRPTAAARSMATAPALSVIIPTFNNAGVLQQCVAAWERYGTDDVELVVVEDGCRDGTADYLDTVSSTAWG